MVVKVSKFPPDRRQLLTDVLLTTQKILSSVCRRRFKAAVISSIKIVSLILQLFPVIK